MCCSVVVLTPDARPETAAVVVDDLVHVELVTHEDANKHALTLFVNRAHPHFYKYWYASHKLALKDFQALVEAKRCRSSWWVWFWKVLLGA